MPLQSPHRYPERILITGTPKTGKSTSHLNIAKWLQRTKSPGKVYVAETDIDSVGRMLDEGYPNLTNVHISPIFEWDEFKQFVQRAQSFIRDDWIVIDSNTATWDMVQAWFVDQVFHKGIDEYFVQVRKTRDKADSSLTAFEGWMDWPVINKNYRAQENRLLFRTNAHILVTAEWGPIDSKTDDAQILDLFQKWGGKCVGQKQMAYRYHTILLTQTKGDTYYMNTIGDRERAKMIKQPIRDFAIQYLCDIAGWTTTGE